MSKSIVSQGKRLRSLHKGFPSVIKRDIKPSRCCENDFLRNSPSQRCHPLNYKYLRSGTPPNSLEIHRRYAKTLSSLACLPGLLYLPTSWWARLPGNDGSTAAARTAAPPPLLTLLIRCHSKVPLHNWPPAKEWQIMFYLFFFYWLTALLAISRLLHAGYSRRRGNGMKPGAEIADCETVRTPAYNRCPEKPHKLLPGSACVQKNTRTGGVWSRAFVWQDRACTAETEPPVGRESYLQMSISTFSRGDNQVKGHPTHWSTVERWRLPLG